MSLHNLSTLISKYPDKADTFKHINSFISARKTILDNSYPLSNLLDKLCLKSSMNSLLTIQILEDEGVISKIFRVESPSLGGLGDFNSISEIPLIINDFRTDTDLKVKPQHISVLYKISNTPEVASQENTTELKGVNNS